MPRVTPAITTRGSGRPTVTYRDIAGQTYDAVVTAAAGTVLSLYVPQLPAASRRKTGITRATTRVQTNVWK